MPIKVGDKWVERPKEKAERERKEQAKEKLKELKGKGSPKSIAELLKRVEEIERFLDL